jgi:hypothetical protein
MDIKVYMCHIISDNSFCENLLEFFFNGFDFHNNLLS